MTGLGQGGGVGEGQRSRPFRGQETWGVRSLGPWGFKDLCHEEVKNLGSYLGGQE